MPDRQQDTAFFPLLLGYILCMQVCSCWQALSDWSWQIPSGIGRTEGGGLHEYFDYGETDVHIVNSNLTRGQPIDVTIKTDLFFSVITIGSG